MKADIQLDYYTKRLQPLDVLRRPAGGAADLLRSADLACGAWVQTLWAAFADKEQTNAIQQLRGSVHAFGQEHVCARGLIAYADFSGEQNCGSLRRNSLDGFDQFGSVETWHHQVRKHQVNAAALEMFQGIFTAGAGDDAIASRFQQDFSDGE
jgi:hypothetical protein